MGARIRDPDVRTSAVESFPLAYRLYAPLRKVVREAWESAEEYVCSFGTETSAGVPERVRRTPSAAPARSGRNDAAEVTAYLCGDSGDLLPPADRAPTESAPCGCSLIEVLERCSRCCNRIQAAVGSRSFHFSRCLAPSLPSALLHDQTV